jgi:hypothetical protein
LHVLFPPFWPGCGMSLSPVGSLALAQSLPYSPLVQSRFCLSVWFLSETNSLRAAYSLPRWWRPFKDWRVEHQT